MHRRDAVHHLADPAGEAAGGELALAPEAQQFAPQRGITTNCTPTTPAASSPSQTFWSRMKAIAVAAWVPRKAGRM